MSFRHVRARASAALLLASVALASGASGCAGAGGGGSIPPLLYTQHALMIGASSGPALDAVKRHFAVSSGSGSEDPSAYDMLIVDTSTMPAATLRSSGAAAKFLNAGKMLVLLNASDADRETILKGTVWARAQGSSPATAFFIPRNADGTPSRQVTEIDFPVRLAREATAGCTVDPAHPCPLATATPDAAGQAADATTWIDTVRQRFLGSGGGGVIAAPSSGPGQAAYTFDVVQPLTLQVPSAVNEIIPGRDGLFGGGDGYWCSGTFSDPNTTCGYYDQPSLNQPNIWTTETATFETAVSAMLEPNGPTYQHEVILRQYSLVSPTPLVPDPAADWRYAYYEEFLGVGGPTPAVRTLTTTLGFNASTWLRGGPDGTWQSAYPMGLVGSLPQNANNVSTLTTSTTHTEGVSVSVTGSTEKSGEVGASWNDSWSWQSLHTISIPDWSVQQSGDVQYVYEASGNTPDTYDRLVTYQRQYTPDGTYDLNNGGNNLNALEAGNMTAEGESDWISSGGPVGPVEETMQSSDELVQGEVYMFQHCNNYDYGQRDCKPSYYAATPSFTYPENIVLDFGTPALQPATQAPWTLSFSPWPATIAQQTTVTGTVRIPDASQNPGPIAVSYVVEPLATVQTEPAGEACPGNQYTFVPGNNVINNGSPPLSITIPQGQTTATFPLTVQTFGQPYNIQVVAWQATGTLNGSTVANLQSAWCLTVPDTTP